MQGHRAAPEPLVETLSGVYSGHVAEVVTALAPATIGVNAQAMEATRLFPEQQVFVTIVPPRGVPRSLIYKAQYAVQPILVPEKLLTEEDRKLLQLYALSYGYGVLLPSDPVFGRVKNGDEVIINTHVDEAAWGVARVLKDHFKNPWT
ncbi:MAG: hypothetical protein HYS81_05065 [Candidatus Aenigmatarchaeota archaeon]|nr:MAG: hypothetical protein HYS81_05065 [Candidatus Aenigmarchaeota archaeon]